MKLLLILLFFSLSVSTSAQEMLGATEQQILDKFRDDETCYKVEYASTSEGVPYLVYKALPYYKDSFRTKAYYFANGLDKTCTFNQFIYPAERSNEIIKLLNESFVKIGENKWRDYRYNQIWELWVSMNTITVVECYPNKE